MLQWIGKLIEGAAYCVAIAFGSLLLTFVARATLQQRSDTLVRLEEGE